MAHFTKPQTLCADGITAPLRYPAFRRIWLASLLSNLGSLIQGVGAAWVMTQMTPSADKVTLVQTALSLPVMLIGVPAGAIADIYDRRIVALIALSIALCAATGLTVLEGTGLATPNLLLLLCFGVGSGAALISPAWQSSVSEQVPPRSLPAAIALDGLSYNIARSLGPAIGGMVLATAGVVATFALNAVSYLPLMAALFVWKRVAKPTHLPPEHLGRAMISGTRYISHSPAIKIVLIRTIMFGLAGGSLIALMPLVTRDLLHGSARTYGLLLGAFGLGAVIGAFNFNQVRNRMSGESVIRVCALSTGLAMTLVALSREPLLTALPLVLAGAMWMMAWATLNTGIQLSAPRWVAGRALAAYQAAASGGIALGSWAWGQLTDVANVETALLCSAALMVGSPLLGFWLRMPKVNSYGDDPAFLADPEVRLPLSGRSGPLVVEIEYRVARHSAQDFHNLMQQVQQARRRNGAYGWSIARDIADPELWTERFHCPTWLDYLRHRNRPTQSERALDRQAVAFHIGPGPVRVRRMLERPSGSMRSKDDMRSDGAK